MIFYNIYIYFGDCDQRCVAFVEIFLMAANYARDRVVKIYVFSSNTNTFFT